MEFRRVLFRSLSQMELEVSVDEADVGQVKDGQRATFTVDAFPGQTFPARIERVNVGSNTSDTSSSSSTSSSTSAGTVVAYTAVLSVNNRNLPLRPGLDRQSTRLTSNHYCAPSMPSYAD